MLFTVPAHQTVSPNLLLHYCYLSSIRSKSDDFVLTVEQNERFTGQQHGRGLVSPFPRYTVVVGFVQLFFYRMYGNNNTALLCQSSSRILHLEISSVFRLVVSHTISPAAVGCAFYAPPPPRPDGDLQKKVARACC